MNWLSADLWRGRRVLVTGGSGFLGGWLCQLLIQAEAQVHSTGNRNRPHWGTVFHQVMLPKDTEYLVQHTQPEVVFHLAGPVNPGDTPELRSILRSGIVDATASVIDATKTAGARLIHAGTCAEYGSCESPHNEDSPPQPQSPYGELKWMASQLVLAAGGTVLRPFRAIGPGDQNSVVASAATAALNGHEFPMTEGSQVREWNHVKAVAHGFVAAAAHPATGGQIINIGGGETRSVIEVIETVFRLAGAPESLIQRGALAQRKGEVDLLAGNHERAQRLWGTIQQPNLDDTLMQAVNWIKNARGDAA